MYNKAVFILIMLAAFIPAAMGDVPAASGQFRDFIRHCVKNSSPNSFDPEMQGSGFNWTFEGKYQVVYANEKFFSYCTEELSYIGGAHGVFTVNAGSMYRISGVKIKLEDIAGTASQKKKLLTLIVLQTARIFKCPVSTLHEKLLNMPRLTENFYLDGSGITFIYNEYEIASKGAGPIKIFIPYKEFQVKIK